MTMNLDNAPAFFNVLDGLAALRARNPAAPAPAVLKAVHDCAAVVYAATTLLPVPRWSVDITAHAEGLPDLMRAAVPHLDFGRLKGWGLVVAGGSVTSMLRAGELGPAQDIDLFFVNNPTEEAIKRVLEELCDSLLERWAQVQETRRRAEVPMRVTRSRACVTFHFGAGAAPIQVILRVRDKGLGEVLDDFDLPCCRVAWDGDGGVFTTPSGFATLVTGIIPLEACERSWRFETRVCKYMARGFALGVPLAHAACVQERRAP